MRALWTLWVLAMGCGSAPAPVEPPPPLAPATPTMNERGPKARRADPRLPADPVLAAELHALGVEGRAAIEACAAVATPAIEAWRPGGTFALDAAALATACDGVTATHDAHEALVGRFRSGHRALNGLARVSEDVRVLGLHLTQPERRSTIDGAIDHLRRSVVEELAGMDEAVRSVDEPDLQRFVAQVVDRTALVEELHRMVANDQHDLGNLAETFDNYAWSQREGAELVRGRMLKHFSSWAAAIVASHRARVASLTVPDGSADDVIAAAGRYLDAADQLARAYAEGAAAFLSGPIALAEADRHRAAVVSASEGWTAARAEVTPLLGGR